MALETAHIAPLAGERPTQYAERVGKGYAEASIQKDKKHKGQVLTPEMSVVVSTNLSNPFNNGAKEVAEAYMRIYGFDYKRSCCCKTDFECVLLG